MPEKTPDFNSLSSRDVSLRAVITLVTLPPQPVNMWRLIKQNPGRSGPRDGQWDYSFPCLDPVRQSRLASACFGQPCYTVDQPEATAIGSLSVLPTPVMTLWSSSIFVELPSFPQSTILPLRVGKFLLLVLALYFES